jgi:hypothetical protein
MVRSPWQEASKMAYQKKLFYSLKVQAKHAFEYRGSIHKQALSTHHQFKLLL